MTDAPPPQSTRAHVLIPFGIVTLIWGSTWLVIRDQLGVVPPSWSVSYRFLVAGVALFIWAAIRREPGRIDARGYAFAAALGLAQFVLNFNFVYRAEQFITSGLVAVTFALLLIPNSLFGRIFLGQRLGRQLVIGSAIAMAGVALLFLHEVRSDPNGPAASLVGIGLTLCAILSASSANVMQGTQIARSYPMLRTTGIAMLMGGAFDAGWAWFTVGPPVMEWRLGYVAGILYLGIFASALAFPLYFGVIRIIGPAKAAYSSVIVPVIAMALSTTFEGYRWSLLAGSGAALAAFGLVVALTARRPNR
ncbi:DMT family transporter [Sphingomonas mucosissima]|uniref:Putative DMT superfamily transporter inner membrane protein n=1 Tax=Sphingomonas mucosissima TaxID=370959 RepID=A0A245ZGS6_9SPHN|nr:EamA family transporter [Sphingomonas mucosissima]OWK28951.1 putative DMT superfamily transporter inner membrane protein [Sphingomonas mucosissima]